MWVTRAGIFDASYPLKISGLCTGLGGGCEQGAVGNCIHYYFLYTSL